MSLPIPFEPHMRVILYLNPAVDSDEAIELAERFYAEHEEIWKVQVEGLVPDPWQEAPQ